MPPAMIYAHLLILFQNKANVLQNLLVSFGFFIAVSKNGAYIIVICDYVSPERYYTIFFKYWYNIQITVHPCNSFCAHYSVFIESRIAEMEALHQTTMSIHAVHFH